MLLWNKVVQRPIQRLCCLPFTQRKVYLCAQLQRFEGVPCCGIFLFLSLQIKVTEPLWASVLLLFWVCMYVFHHHFWGQGCQCWAQSWLSQDSTAWHLPQELLMQQKLLFNQGCLPCILYLGKYLLKATGTRPECIPGEAFELVTAICKFSAWHSGIS